MLLEKEELMLVLEAIQKQNYNHCMDNADYFFGNILAELEDTGSKSADLSFELVHD